MGKNNKKNMGIWKVVQRVKSEIFTWSSLSLASSFVSHIFKRKIVQKALTIRNHVHQVAGAKRVRTVTGVSGLCHIWQTCAAHIAPCDTHQLA